MVPHITNEIKAVSYTHLDVYKRQVIGPFYQVNVEKVADALENKNIPVISPLSRDEGKSYKNLFQSMPHADAVKGAMFNYMQCKNGNIIAVIDPKKTSIKEYICLLYTSRCV